MMTNRRVISIAGSGVCLLAVLIAASGCKSDRTGRDRHEPVGKTTVTGTDVRPMLQSVSDRLTSARCDRAIECHQVGPSQLHVNLQACQEFYKTKIAEELNPEKCPYGVDEGRVVKCIAATEHTGCDDPVGALMRVEDCRADKLCLKKGQ